MSPLSVPSSWAHLAQMGHPRGPRLTSLTQSDMMWVLGVRKWKLRTTTQITTTAVTSSMMKSRYLGWRWHRGVGMRKATLGTPRCPCCARRCPGLTCR